MNKTYLIHHGIKGQKWGDRQAEWYPIDEYKAAQKRDKTQEKKNKKAENWRKNALKKNQRQRNIVDRRDDKQIEKFKKQANKDIEKINNTTDSNKKAKLISKQLEKTDIENRTLASNRQRRERLEQEFKVLNKMSVDELLDDRNTTMKRSQAINFYTRLSSAPRDEYQKSLMEKNRVNVYDNLLDDQMLRRRIGELDIKSIEDYHIF